MEIGQVFDTISTETYLRSTVTQTIFTGPAILHVHYNVEIDLEETIQSIRKVSSEKNETSEYSISLTESQEREL